MKDCLVKDILKDYYFATTVHIVKTYDGTINNFVGQKDLVNMRDYFSWNKFIEDKKTLTVYDQEVGHVPYYLTLEPVIDYTYQDKIVYIFIA